MLCHSEGAVFATEESLTLVLEMLRYAQHDILNFPLDRKVGGSFYSARFRAYSRASLLR
jgi:hypothetical protein